VVMTMTDEYSSDPALGDELPADFSGH
jgi:hypothetical protein